MSDIATILDGATIVNKDGQIKISDLKNKKVVGFYFSAHWCPPCRGFTPKLSEEYKKAIGMEKYKDCFEIIFISADRDQASFDSYFGEMPFCALSFDCSDVKNKLSSHFSVSGIPYLVFIDPNTGETKTTNGRGQVQQSGLTQLLDNYI